MPLGPADFLALARQFHTVVIDAIPVIDAARRDEANDESAVATWRNHAKHRTAQVTGRGGVFRDYRLRVAGATSDIFSNMALAELYHLSGGVPRVINVVADRALLGAYTQDRHRVTNGLVRRTDRS